MNRSIIFASALLPSVAAFADVEPSMSFQGFSGLINTPTASLFEEGKFYFQYGNQVEIATGYRNGDNYNFGMGLWKYLEVSGRLADYTAPGEPGITDLSANVKLGIPFIPQDWFKLAIGFQDLGGANDHFSAKYAVASKTIFENISLSFGIGESNSASGRLDGVFGGVAWQPYEWVKVSAEYDAADTQVGLHLSTPESWLVGGTQITSDILVSSTNEDLKDDFYYGLGLTIPLDYSSSGTSSAYKQDDDTRSDIKHYSTDAIDINSEQSTSIAERTKLQDLLVEAGFESIKIGEADLQTLYVEVENHVYNRNQIDGLGVILGLISNNIHYNYANFKLVLKEREVPILLITGSIAEYDAFLRDNQPLKINVSTDTFGSQQNNGTELIESDNNIWFKPRFTFWPGTISRVGTELGVFDASLALVSHVEIPLWPGAAVTALHTAQVAETKNFEDGEYFADEKHDTAVLDYSLHQTFSLPFSIKNMTSVGKFSQTYNYLSNEMRWQSFGGGHKVSLFTARYENQEIAERTPYPGCNPFFAACWPAEEEATKNIILGKYQYYSTKFDATAEIQVGQYWQQDKGVVFTLERMFGDVWLNLTYKNTKFDGEEANQFIGLGFTIPLTPRKDYNNKYFQVRGKPNWKYSVNTLVGDNHNRLTPGTGDNAQMFYNLDTNYYNSNRLGSDYIYDNANRLKQAYYEVR